MTHLLSPAHLKMLDEDRSIALPLIQQRGYQSLPQPEDLIDRGFSRRKPRPPRCSAFPCGMCTASGTAGKSGPTRPRQFADGKLGKYEMPKGEHLILDVHPSVQPLLGDPQAPLMDHRRRAAKGMPWPPAASAPSPSAACGGTGGRMSTAARSSSPIGSMWPSMAARCTSSMIRISTRSPTSRQPSRASTACCGTGRPARPGAVAGGVSPDQDRRG